MPVWKHQIESLRARIVVIRLWAGILTALAAALAGLAAGVLAGCWLSPPIPLILLLSGLVAALAVLVRYGIRHLRGLTAPRLAARIERAAPGLGGRLVSAVEFEAAVRDPAAWPFSAELTREFLNRVDAELPDVELSRICTTRPLGRAFFLLASAFVLTAVAFAAAPGGASHLFRLRPPPAPPPAAALAARKFTVHYEYPAYTGLATHTVEDSDGTLAALKGTHATLTIRFNRRVEDPAIRLSSGEAVPLSVDPAGEIASAVLVLTTPGTYRIEARLPDGTAASLPEAPIRIVSDAPPGVRIVSVSPPADDRDVIEIEPDGLIELRFQASDDFGLSQARLLGQAPGQDEPRELARNALTGSLADGKLSLALAEKRAELPGPAFRLWIEADDNDTVSGPKTTRSRVLTVRLLTPERRHDRVLAYQRLLLHEMLQLLADQLESRPTTDPNVFESLQRRLASRLARTIQAGETCLAHLRPDPLADYNAYKAIERMTDRRRAEFYRRGRVLLSAARHGGRSLPDQFLADLAPDDAADTKALEADVLLLDDLIRTQEMASIAKIGKELAASRKQMEELIEKLKDGTLTPELRREVRRRIEELERRIAELTRRMAALARELPSQFVNPDALPRAQADKIASLQQEIRKALAEGREEDALRLAAELSRVLESSLQSMSQGMEQWADGSFGQGMEAMRRIEQSLREIRESQSELVQDTGTIRDRHDAEARKALQDEIDQAIEQIRRKARGTRRLAAEAAGTGDEPQPPQTPLGAVDEDLKRLDAELEHRRLDEAEDHARRARANVLRWASGLAVQRSVTTPATPDTPRPPAPPEAEELERLSGEITEDIAALRKRLREATDASAARAEGEQLQGMAGKQGRNSEAAAQLQKRMDELAGKNPLVGREPADSLREARQWMEGARRGLEARRPSGALEDEKRALEALDDAARDIKEGIRQVGSARRLQPMPLPPSVADRQPGGRSGYASEDFEIPGPDRFRAPRAFREDIMRILSGGLPEPYRKLNEEYYRSLVE
jgi:hypothetical protein